MDFMENLHTIADRVKNVTISNCLPTHPSKIYDPEYVDSLSNADTGNTNIYLNGYSLYVGGTALSANDGEAPEVVTAVKTTGSVNSSSSEFPAAFAAVGIIILLAAAGCTAFVVVKTKDKNNRNHNHK